MKGMKGFRITSNFHFQDYPRIQVLMKKIEFKISKFIQIL